MSFRSDNEAPTHEAVMAALIRANQGLAGAYASDAYSQQLNQAFSACFDCECQVLPVSTGTAANSIALAELSPPWGSIFCHQSAHIHCDEGGAPEFYSHGAKLALLPGEAGRIDARTLAQAIDGAGQHGVHNAKPSAVSLTQATECGTVYAPEQVQALCEVAHARGLSVHMDGARFANAVAFLGCHPADITWRAGVDVLSFGATKNGALTAEALVVFGHPEWMEGLERRRKRGGHLLSKMRYLSAQLLALLEDDLWLQLASTANARAAQLAAGIQASDSAQLHWPVEANEVFMRADPAQLDRLAEASFSFHRWPGHHDVARLVCSFNTEASEVDRFLAAL